MRPTHLLLAAWLIALMTAVGLSAERRIFPTRYYNSFDHRHEPLARIAPGEVIVTRIIDAGGTDEHGQKAGQRPNPLTGPFYVEGAEPGDALEVTIERLRPNRNYGFTSFRLGLFALTPESIEGLYPRRYQEDLVEKGRNDIVPWDIHLDTMTVKLREPRSKAHPMEFPAEPMLGCIGVAAPGVFAPTSAISGSYGGNIDYNRIREGTTLLLPVYHPGALLFVGDGHALQADGEPTGTGIEVSMDLTFRVNLRKHANLPNPRLITPDSIISIASQPEFVSSLDRSLRIATSDMVDWLIQDYAMEPWAAHLLIGYQGRYDVVTVMGSLALRLPKSVLPARR